MIDCVMTNLEDVYLKIVEASPDAMVVIDEKGKIIVFNSQAELMFGYDRQEVLGEAVEILVPDDKRQVHADTHRTGYLIEPRIREMGTGQLLEGLHRAGSRFNIQIKLAPMIIPRKGVHVLAVVRRVNISGKESP